MIEPSISIILPVYNVEKYLAECINSILLQTVSDFELIIVNDGSTDSSGIICNDYQIKDSRIKVFHQPNSGVSTARNFGISKAQGEWITFIDSDDWVDPDFLRYFDIKAYQDCDMICQGLKYIDHHSSVEKKRKNFSDKIITAPDNEHLLKKYDVLNFGVTVCKCFRRDKINEYGLIFNSKISYHEDHLFTFDYLYHSQKISLVGNCGYNYRCGHNPSSLSKKTHLWQSQELASRLLFQSLKKINTKYNIGEEYFLKMASFCIEPRVNAVIGMYKDVSIEQKRKTMVAIFQPIEDFRKFYHPKSRLKILPLLAFDRTGVLLHIFFSLYSKLKN